MTIAKDAPLLPHLTQVERDQLVVTNLRLAYHLAKRYARGDASLKEDLAQEGMIGLIKAADKFDPARGVPFGAYAALWVRARITRYLARLGFGTISLGSSVAAMKMFSGIGAVCRKLGVWDLAEADAKEVAAYLGISVDDYLALLPFFLPTGDCNFAADNPANLHVDPVNPELTAAERQAVRTALDWLPPKEAEIIQRAFLQESAESLDAIGQDARLWGGRTVTRERVRQVKEKALGRLRCRYDLAALAGRPASTPTPALRKKS